jgi:Tol biopolymer transport system component
VPRARILGLAVLVAIPFAPAAGRASTPSLIVFSADRAPLVSSVIYRLDPNGNRVDLSQSGFDALEPVVSPDGKKVAFFSFRNSEPGQGARIFEVDADGTKLRDMAPALTETPEAGEVAWQPHGDRLAAIAQSTINGPFTLWILRWGHRPIRLVSGGGFGGGSGTTRESSWSPDGRVLVAWSGYKWRAFSPSGRRLWTHESKDWGGCCRSIASWSAHGLLAITTQQKLRVYDESGHTGFKARLPPGRISPPSWSPSGREVAVVAGSTVEVRTAGGRLVLRRRVPVLNPQKQSSVAWAGDRRLVAGIPGKGPQEGVDVRTGKLWNASNQWFDPRSADGKLAAVTSGTGASFAIGVAHVGGGPNTLYGPGTDCGPTAAVNSLQFDGRSRSLVYTTACGSAFGLFSMAPDGSGVHEVTDIQPNVSDPVLSPDGTEVAYESAPLGNASCETDCGAEIRVANIDGTNVRVLAQPDACAEDGSPTWSPDGQTILFFKGYYSSPKSGACDGGPVELYTVPAAGGSPPHDLGVAGAGPAWGPERIAYVGEAGLTTANPDGSDPVVVASTGRPGAWSPDGRLAYLAGAYGTTVVVGSTQVQLPFAQVSSLSWSPDGTRFIVTAQKTLSDDSEPDVYTVNTDGTDPVRLTTGYDARGATWR